MSTIHVNIFAWSEAEKLRELASRGTREVLWRLVCGIPPGAEIKTAGKTARAFLKTHFRG